MTSTTERFAFRAAVYLILIKDGKVLLARRSNTGWSDGKYTLPAGHADGDESMRIAMVRETAEEIGIHIPEAKLEFAHVMHHKGNYEYIDFYFAAKDWQGEPTNLEPEKCDDLQWFSLKALPENILPNVKQAVTNYQNGTFYSEFGW